MKLIINYIILCVLLTILNPVDLQAQNFETEYSKGDYSSAILELEKIRAKGGVNSALFYNLGNAYAKSGDYGGAVLNYEKALKLSPSDSDVENNLKYVSNLVQLSNESNTDGKNLDPTPADAGIVENIQNIVAGWSSNLWAIVSLILFFIAVGGSVCYIFITNVAVRKAGFFGGVIALLLFALTLWCSIISKRRALDRSMGVLMTDNVTLVLKPDVEATPVGTPLSAGTKLKIMNSDKDSEGNSWTEVYLNSEYSGWIPTSDIAVIEISETAE